MKWIGGHFLWRRAGVGNETQRKRFCLMPREMRIGEVCGEDAREGDLVRCESGVMWVTTVGGGDVILRAGESLRVTRRGRVVVEALRAGTWVLLRR